MTSFRKIPVVVDATQWFKNGDHPLDYIADREYFVNNGLRIITGQERKQNNLEGDIVRCYRHPNVSGTCECRHCQRKMEDHGWIDTLEDGQIVCPGDYIITDVYGGTYSCKPDIFAKTYEVVNNE